MGDVIRNDHFDAIVIGSGMSGGWAAKEFTEKGFRTLVLERGRDVRHLKDYPTTNLLPWEFEHRGEIPYDVREAARDGYAVDWPIRYKDLAPWYSYVEKFVGISGNKDSLSQLPDGEFLPPLELTCVETYFAGVVRKKYADRPVIYGRCAHLTEPTALHLQQGRGQCQKRTLCQRGCPFGGYYNSNSATIPWADVERMEPAPCV